MNDPDPNRKKLEKVAKAVKRREEQWKPEKLQKVFKKAKEANRA